LDAIDENGQHWTGQMETQWITWKEQWKKNTQQPYDLWITNILEHWN
jgi:hypothetical protein